jgi:beta-glucosidase
VMPSYSSFNGEKMHGSRYWITDVLKGELGFDGFVISDWDAFFQLEAPGDELSYNDVVTSANAGIDMFMASSAYREVIGFLIDAVNSNEVSMDRIDDAVRRILTVKHRMHLFEHPRSQSQYLGDIYSPGHRALARQAARESLVLLKNEDNLLPLSPDATVCLNGSGADNMAAQTGGWTLGWTEPLMEVQGVTIAEALNDYLQDKSGSVVDSGCDVGIRVVTETPATYAEYYGDSADPVHDDSGSCDAVSGCVVVVLGGRPLDIEGLISDSASKAVVMGWYPGSEGGSGIIDALYGVDGATFTGKLPVTWKIDTWDSPMNYCEGDQCGDIGDHYSDAANPSDGVLFPYGFGLSY